MKKTFLLVTMTYALGLYGTPHALFKKVASPLKGEAVVSDVQALTLVADDTAHFLKKVSKSNFVKVDNGVFDHHMFTIDDVQETAEFIANVGKKNPKLLKSAWFYNEYFDFYWWHADDKMLQKIPAPPRGWGKPPEYIRTTTYRACKVHGSPVKTKYYTCPLYMLPSDEKGKTPDYVRAHRQDLVRFTYTFDQIKQGVLEKSTLTMPLAWLDHHDYKEFTIQGTVKVVFEDGKEQILRVAGSNGKTGEEKYWFASPVVYKDPRMSKHPLKVEPQPEVSFAGNFKELGFGKVILLRGWNKERERLETRIGLLVDTGEAFKGNLYQLDIFTGYFDSKEEYHQKVKGYPHTAQAYILIKKKNKTLKL